MNQIPLILQLMSYGIYDLDWELFERIDIVIQNGGYTKNNSFCQYACCSHIYRYFILFYFVP